MKSFQLALISLIIILLVLLCSCQKDNFSVPPMYQFSSGITPAPLRESRFDKPIIQNNYGPQPTGLTFTWPYNVPNTVNLSRYMNENSGEYINLL